jgi:hypothetical protein
MFKYKGIRMPDVIQTPLESFLQTENIFVIMESLKGFNIRNAEDEDNSKQMVINDTVHGHIGISALSGQFQT